MVGELVNPYIAGAPVTEAKMFFGREDVFDWIQNSLVGKYADHILVIHGQRRVGKTSVLKQLGNRLPQRYMPVFFDLQGRTHTSLDRFLWWLAREIVRVLKQERGMEIPVPDKDAFSADLEYFESHFMANLLPKLGGGSLLLTFDEFDNLEESEIKETLARPLVDYLRRLMGRQGLNFIFSIGSSGRKLENMQADYTEFFKTALYKKISFLNEEQTRNLITRPVEGVLEYDQPAVNRIYRIAGGHPYFTQLTCHELFAGCQRTGETYIREKDVESVLDDVVERGTVNLKFVWDEASDIEKWTLASLADLDKPDNRTLADRLRKQNVRFTESDLTSGLLHLREKEILTPENCFVIHLLRLWLQKNRPIEQVREELTEVNPIANRYIEIGLEFKNSGQHEKAIESFQEALAVSAGNIQAQVSIALVYMDQKAYDKAVGEFEKALAIDDEDVTARAGLCEAHLALGDAATQKGRWKEAAQSYQRVLIINEEHTEARQRMTEINRQRAEKALTEGRDEEALTAFADAMKYAPEDEALAGRVEAVRAEKKAKVIAAQIARSEKEANARNWEAAAHTLEEAARLAPDDPDIQKRLAETREKLREGKLVSLRTKAQAAIKAENFVEALKAWQEYVSLEPEDRGKAESEIIRLKKLQELEETYNKAQQAITDKSYDKAIGLLKEVIVQDENFKDASRLLVQAIELRRSSRPARFTGLLPRILKGLLIAVGIAGLGMGVYFAWNQWGDRLANLFPAEKVEKVCFIMTGDDAYSFRNSAIWHGILNTAESVGIQKQSYLTGISPEEVRSILEKMYDEDCDLIVGNGEWLKEQFLESARKKPDIYFLPVDVNYEGTPDPLPDNLIEQTYDVRDGAYLAGYLAGGTTEMGKVGMFGSSQLHDYREYMEGFVAGMARYNQDHSTQIPVIVWDANSQSVIGWPGDWKGWSVENNENRVPYESMADELIRGGADIILIVGMPNASRDALALSDIKSVKFIGVNEDWKSQREAGALNYPDAILVSVAKNYDLMILKTIKQLVSGTYAGGAITGTLENYGVQLTYDKNEIEDQLFSELYQIQNELTGLPKTPPKQSTPLPTATADPRISNPANQHLYQYMEQGTSWHDARDVCALQGGYLVTIQDAEENEFIYQLTKGNTWLGATDEIEEGTWVWVNGEPWDFQNWDQGEPSNGNQIETEHFLTLETSSMWNDVPEGENSFACEWDSADSSAEGSVTPTTPEIVDTFSAPILTYIADNPPTFEDDFSNPDMGWGSTSEGFLVYSFVEGGTLTIKDHWATWEGLKPDYHVPGLSFPTNNLFSATDFALKVDFAFEGSARVGAQFRFSIARNTGYEVSLTSNGRWNLTQNGDTIIASGNDNSIRGYNTLLLVVHGENLAIFLNDSLLCESNELTLSGTTNKITVEGNYESAGGKFDNIKFWNLDAADFDQ